MAYEEVKGDPIVKLDATNPSIEGVLLDIESGMYGPQFKIKKLNGDIVILGNQTVLATKIKKDFVGKKIKVDFAGEVKSKKSKFSYVDYKVYLDK